MTLLAWLAQGALRRQPPRLLAGNRGNAVVVLVVVPDRHPGRLGRGGDQEVVDPHAAVMQGAAGELGLDLFGTTGDAGVERDLVKSVQPQLKLQPQLTEGV